MPRPRRRRPRSRAAACARAGDGVRAGRRGGVVVLHDLTTLDLTAPGTRCLRAALDEVLEPLEVASHPPLDHAQRSTEILDRALGVHVELEGHPRARGALRLESNGAVIARTLGAPPRDHGV